MASVFSQRLKELREGLGLSQLELAKKIQTSQANISRWEKEIQDPSTNWIITIAKFFEVTTDYLLGVED